MSNDFAVRSIQLVFLSIAALLAFAWAGNAAYADDLGQISIAGNGQTMIRNATVTAITGSSLVIETGWGETKLIWHVETTGSTTFYPQMESEEALRAIKVGDSVSLSGVLDMSTKKPTIRATALRDNSLEDTDAQVNGTVVSLDPRNGTFSLETASGTITVAVGSRGVILRDGNPIGLTRLEIGEAVAVSGAHNFVTSTVRAVKVASSSVEHEPQEDESERQNQPEIVVPAAPSFLTRVLSWIYGSPGQVTIR